MKNAAPPAATKKIEIAYQVFGRDDRLVSRRKIVAAAKLSATLDKLREDGARDIVTRDAE